MSKKRAGMIDTERRQIDAARFNALVQDLGDLVTLHDATGAIIYATPLTARLLGYPEEQLIGTNAFELIHPEDLIAARQALSRVLSGQNLGAPTEYRVRRSDGVWVDVETIGTNLLDDAAIGGIILTSRIITERKQHERQLEAITGFAAALRTAPTRDELLSVILDQVIRLLSVDGAALVLRYAGSEKPARKAWLPDQAADHIRTESGKSFSPVIVETFLQNLPSVVGGGR